MKTITVFDIAPQILVNKFQHPKIFKNACVTLYNKA